MARPRSGLLPVERPAHLVFLCLYRVMSSFALLLAPAGNANSKDD